MKTDRPSLFFFMRSLYLASLALCAICLLTPACSKPAPAKAQSAAEKSILRVNVTYQRYNFSQPWQKGATGKRRGIGTVIGGNRVLTTAEIVADATYVELENAQGKRITARVATVDYEANLALIEASKESFLKDFHPLELDTKANIGDALEVWQLESKGTAFISKGVINNVTLARYFLSVGRFLAYEMKGSLQYKSGSFTVPAVKNGKLVGLLLSYSTDDQLATILPAPIIQHFLNDLDDGNYEGFPSLGVSFAWTQDAQFRDYLKLEEGEGGVFVSKLQRGGSAAEAGIQIGDVILEINGHSIDARGYYQDPVYGKLSLGHLTRGAVYTNDEILLKIKRKGVIKELPVIMRTLKANDHMVAPYLFDQGPNFFLLGGMLFQELTLPYLQSFGEKWRTRAPFGLIYSASQEEKFQEEGRRKIVFLSFVIPTPATVGYERVGGVIINAVNGKKISDITDLEQSLLSPKGGIHEISLDQYPYFLYIDANLANQVNEALQSRYGITKLKRME